MIMVTDATPATVRASSHFPTSGEATLGVRSYREGPADEGAFRRGRHEFDHGAGPESLAEDVCDRVGQGGAEACGDLGGVGAVEEAGADAHNDRGVRVHGLCLRRFRPSTWRRANSRCWPTWSTTVPPASTSSPPGWRWLRRP